MLVEKWTEYRDTRKATYEYRLRTRYAAVLQRLRLLGLQCGDSVFDVGAGTRQFGRCLTEHAWYGDYQPVDAVDGTDLEDWHCPPCDYAVCIEVVEHLLRPERLIRSMIDNALYTVLTTPNSEAVNVLTCDPTHISIVPAWILETMGFTVERHSWFGVPNDSLLAWRRNDNG